MAARGREEALIAMGWAAAIVIVAMLLIFVLANDGGVATTFFNLDGHQAVVPARWSTRSGPTSGWRASSEVLVLIFGLLVAIVRMLPGRAGAPLRCHRAWSTATCSGPSRRSW